MLKIGTRLVLWIAVTGFVCIQPALAQSEVVPFAEQARAVFKKRCVSCHSQSQARGGLDMTSLEGILAGSNSGAVVEPGKPAESLVYTLSAHQDTPKMPPNAPKIPMRELNAIAGWIQSLEPGARASRPQPSNQLSASAPESRMQPAESDGEDVKGSSAIVEGLVDIEPVTGPLAITALASSKSLLAVSGFHQVLLFDTSSDRWLGALNFPEGDVFALKFTADAKQLIAGGGIGGQSGSVVCWDLQSFRRLSCIAVDDDVVLAMDVSPDGKLLALGGPKRLIEVIELATGIRRHVLRKHADWVTKLAFSLDGVFLASGDRFGGIYLWDVQGGTQFDTVASHACAVTGLQFSQDSNQLWSAGKDGQVHQWDLQSAKLAQQWPVSSSGITNLLVHTDQVWTVDNESRLTHYGVTGQQQARQTFAQPLTLCVEVQSPQRQLVLADQQSGLHWLNHSIEGKPRSMLLPQRVQNYVANRISPKPVERELQMVQSPEKKSDSTAEASQDTAIALAREAIDTSREALAKTKQSLAELESKILELQRALERLESK